VQGPISNWISEMISRIERKLDMRERQSVKPEVQLMQRAVAARPVGYSPTMKDHAGLRKAKSSLVALLPCYLTSLASLFARYDTLTFKHKLMHTLTHTHIHTYTHSHSHAYLTGVGEI